MLSEADVEKYKEIQAQGISIPDITKLVSIKEATKIVGRTIKAILGARVEHPGVVGGKTGIKAGITWFVVGSIVMLDKASLIQEALRRGWME